MGRSGWDELQLGMRPGLSVLTPSLLLTCCRRISVLDVAGADVSPSILVLWACKLGCSVPSFAMRGLGRVCWWCWLWLQYGNKVLRIMHTCAKQL